MIGSLTLNETGNFLSNFRSGQALSLKFILVDKYGQLYKADNSSKLIIK